MRDEPLATHPDDKDWTWVVQRPCPECGFDPSDVEPVGLPVLIGQALSQWPAVLATPDADKRPTADTWSPLEYACHVRDLLRVFTHRVELALEREVPTFATWDQEAAATERRYWEQDPAQVSADIEAAGEAAAVAFGGVRADQWQRGGLRSDGAPFTVATLGVYALHELVHHAWDVRP